MFRFRPLGPAWRAMAPVALAAAFAVPGAGRAQNTELTPSSDDPDVANRSEAEYTITFTGAWTTAVTPGGVPTGAHFSRLIGGVHNDEAVFLQSGAAASAGVESMAEVGGYTALRNEINAAGANRLSVIQGTTDNIGPTATRTFTNVRLTTDHPRVTLVTMIAPSPDWFVGVSGLSMLDSSGGWKERVSVNLYPWDAGTEEGSEFSLSNSATDPPGVITSIRDEGKFNDNEMATLTFTRTSVLTAAPTIDAVHPGDEALTVLWTAPPGVTGITAYDLRWIATSGDETVDSNWTVVDEAWTEGTLGHVLTGLTDDVGYDVQVRAVTDAAGAWSATVAGTPTEPGDTFSSAVDLPPGTPIGGDLDHYDDVDTFRLTLTEETGVVIYTTGDTDTAGQLFDENGNYLANNDDGYLAHGRYNFLIAETLAAGTYYVEVFSTSIIDRTGPYLILVRTIPDTTGAGDAAEVEVGGSANGLIDPGGDEDWFRFTLEAETDVLLRSGPPVRDTVGELLDGNGVSLAVNDDGFVLGRSNQFLIRRKLAAGTYHVKVKAFRETDTGLYSFHVEPVTTPGSSTAEALALDFDELAAGRIDSATDADYFRIDLAEATHVFARAVSNTVDIDGALLDGTGNAVTANVVEQNFRADGPMGFTLADRLEAGAHFIKVTRSGGDEAGGYAIRMFEDEDTNRVVSDCSADNPPFSDSLSNCLWHLRNRGQVGGTSGQDIRVADVWSGGNLGAGIGVAVVDNDLDEAHPDLADNVDASRGHDYTEDMDGLLDPFAAHGTSVAGVLAARDNDIGVRGVAPRATVYGYNLLRSNIDEHEADAMTRNMATTGVSNNSWGFPDGYGIDSAAEAWEMAVETGIETGYGGKGVVYVWAGGNGAPSDYSNLDGYTSFHGVVTVCAVNDRGVKTAYSEEGANLWVCAPSNESGSVADYGDPRREILAPFSYGRYRPFGGTSAAAPIVSGVVALIRTANAALTWRDVRLILAGSARRNDASDGGWRAGAPRYGAAGAYGFNHKYGFGVVDAKAAVDLAGGWENLPPYIETDEVTTAPDLAVPDASLFGSGATVSSTIEIGTEVEFIEFVETVADFETSSFRDLRVELVSPSNRVSTLSEPWPSLVELDGEFRFGSARHLGEDPAGTWTLRVTDTQRHDEAKLRSWSLKVYGHRSTPGPPAAPTATAGQKELILSWSAPSVVGASVITGYDVRYIPSDAADKADNRWTVQSGVWSSGALTFTVTGLADASRYDVQVRAVNAKGGGVWSESAVVETLPNRPPVKVDDVDDPGLQVGDGAKVVDLSGAFSDPDNDALIYDARSSAPAVARADVSGFRLTLTPVSAGTATITATATDPAGSNMPATLTFDVRVKGRRGVTVSTGALTVDEGSTATYTVVLDEAPTGDVTVTPSAPANRNLSVDPEELVFTSSDWRVEKTVTVEAATDANVNSEPPVTVTHRVSGADYGSVTAASVRVTIVETDTSVLSVRAAEAWENAGPVSFEVTLSRAGASAILVDYATSDASARAGSDYTAAAGTLTFAENSAASQWIVVDVTDDEDDEEERETFRLTLRNPRHASLAGGGSTLQVPGTIVDDDDPEVEASFGSSSYPVTEGGSVNVVVRLNRDPERNLEIDLKRTHHGGTTDDDYSGVPPSVTFGPGVLRQEFLISATDDNTDDDGESVVLSFVDDLPPRVVDGGGTTLAIQDNDAPPGGAPSVGGGGGVGGGGVGGGGVGGGVGGGGVGGGGGGDSSPPTSGDGSPDGDGDPGPGGGGGGAGGGGPPEASITVEAACSDGLCRARTGETIRFEDASGGTVTRRRWDFGDGSGVRASRTPGHAWAAPGFYTVVLRVSDGTVESTASVVFLVEASSPAGTCVFGAATLCQQNSRYSITVDWLSRDGASGPGTVVHRGTNDSGMFWFFDPANWEVLVKVLDGCAVNGHVWVYAASTTDLGYVIRVEDTATGEVKEYVNEPGMPAPAITDATAFRACGR